MADATRIALPAVRAALPTRYRRTPEEEAARRRVQVEAVDAGARPRREVETPASRETGWSEDPTPVVIVLEPPALESKPPPTADLGRLRQVQAYTATAAGDTPRAVDDYA